jgi:hypothetical protein
MELEAIHNLQMDSRKYRPENTKLAYYPKAIEYVVNLGFNRELVPK